MRKTYKYKLKPTPEQERELGRRAWPVSLALQHGLGATHQRPGNERASRVSRYQQEAELKDIRAAMPEYARHPLACLARRAGAARQDLSGVLSPGASGRESGLSALSGQRPLHSLHLQGVSAMGRRWTMASWSSPRSGASPCAGRAHWRARPRPSRSAGKRMAGMSASPARMCRYSPSRHWTGDGHRPRD